MQKPEINNQILPTGMSPVEGQQTKCNIRGDMKALLGKDCEVEKIMRFLKEIEMYEEI